LKPILIGNNDNEAGLQAFAAKSQGNIMSNETKLLTNLGYQCSAHVAAQRRIDKGIQAWRYRWMGVFPNQKISPDAGAWHGSEITHVFGNVNGNVLGGRVKATENQIKVSELMNKAWADFAKDPEKGLLNLGWPIYKEKGVSIFLAISLGCPCITELIPNRGYTDSSCREQRPWCDFCQRQEI
jgi:cholinesterase